MLLPRTPPAKEEIATMKPFEGLGMDKVFVVTSERQARLAVEELWAAGTVGFDTESKPTFRKGEQSKGPHVLQFATDEKVFIFLSHVTECHPSIIELLVSKEVTKIGFDLRGDLVQIASRFEVRPETVVDLGRTFRKLGYKQTIGATSAVAMLFNQRLSKSKSVTTSNWAAKELTERQLLYAANDAFVALKVFHALET
jgi:ribonuclease D